MIGAHLTISFFFCHSTLVRYRNTHQPFDPNAVPQQTTEFYLWTLFFFRWQLVSFASFDSLLCIRFAIFFFFANAMNIREIAFLFFFFCHQKWTHQMPKTHKSLKLKSFELFRVYITHHIQAIHIVMVK